MDQRSEEWFAARCGKVTASRIADLMARTKSGYGAGRRNYMAELVAERLTGVPANGFTNAAMQWGIDTEDAARSAYEFYTDCSVDLIGFVDHPAIAMSGASPDGLVGDYGLVEIKCPNTATHIDTLISKTVPDKYIKQMMWQMACTGRKWCDFVSFDPRMPERHRIWICKVMADDDEIAEIVNAVVGFQKDLDEMIKKLEVAE